VTEQMGACTFCRL